MTLYLPDTNIFIYALAAKEPHAGFLRRWITAERLAVSVIVMAEFLSGAKISEARAFEKLISYFDPLPVSADIARIGAAYRKQYKSMKLPDALIAATCKIHRAILATNNLQDFPMNDIKKQLLT